MGWFGTGRLGGVGHGALLAAALASVLALSACGGSTGAIEPFKPTRLMVLGDENSVVLPDGRKFGVNAVTTGTTNIDCAGNPMWVQTMANVFGLVMAECNPAAATTITAQIYAKAGAKAADVTAQIQQAAAGGAFGDKQLVTIFFGHHDLLELYGQFPARTQEALKTEARARGVALRQQVNPVARAGPAVILVTAPDLGLSPFGAAQTAAFPTETTPTRARFLSDLTDAFNAGLRVTIINDGRLIGLVSADQMVRDIQPPFTAFYGYTNLTTPLCPTTVTVPNCSTTDVVTGGDVLTWAYATDTLFSPALQSRLGQIAASRAVRNPF